MSFSPEPTVIRRAAATLVLLVMGLGGPVSAQMPPAVDILQHSIDYHDPQGLWSWNAFRLRLAGTRPIAGSTLTEIVIDNAVGQQCICIVLSQVHFVPTRFFHHVGNVMLPLWRLP